MVILFIWSVILFSMLPTTLKDRVEQMAAPLSLSPQQQKHHISLAHFPSKDSHVH